MRHRVEVVLNDREEALVRWLAKRDGVSLQRELQMIFDTEMYQCMELYEAEMEAEK